MDTQSKLIGLVLLLATTSGQMLTVDEPQPEIKIIYRELERSALDQFRPMVQDMLYRDYMETDEYLIPFLRTQHYDLAEAKKMLGKAHHWRMVNNMDNILSEDMTKLEKHFPYYSDGIDIEGRPVISWNFGKWNIRRIALAGKMNLLLRYTDRILEEGFTKIRQERELTGKPITQMQIVIDGNGYGLTQHACISCLPFYYNFIKTNDQYYPQCTKNTYIINMPRIFTQLYSLLLPAMTQNTRDSVKLFGHNRNEWIKEFSNNIPLDQLRRSFGGTKTENFKSQ